ncbi:PepSY domain-containing protein [Streptomyces sp. NPDC059096]|uniref:PepSY domain-containing protein n=1 Tax=Streptomyces sp. NPDC059096 TaxID=3346727 RepID=UPI0036C4C581
MKRNFVIAAITAAALIGGGTYTAAVALSSDHGKESKDAAPVVPVVTATPTASSSGAPDDNGGDRDGRDDGAGDDSTVAPAPPKTVTPTPSSTTPGTPRTGLSASQAVAVALASHPGKVSSVERDDDSPAGAERWEIDLLGTDNRWVELKVDAASGSVRVDRDDDGDDDDAEDRAALRAATVDARRAIAAALASVPGTVTSAELDDDRGGRWEVDVRGKDGRTHELNVNAKTAAVSVDSDDHGDDD